MNRIPRTPRGYLTLWYDGEELEQVGMLNMTVHEGDYPTHSTVLGPDGEPYEYEAKAPIGFDMRGSK